MFKKEKRESEVLRPQCAPQKLLFLNYGQEESPQVIPETREFLHIENMANFIRNKKKIKCMQSKINECNKPEVTSRNIRI